LTPPPVGSPVEAGAGRTERGQAASGVPRCHLQRQGRRH